MSAVRDLIKATNWYALQHAYGDGSGVPAMLEQLRSRTKTTREQGWGELFAALRHQGDVYESSIFMVKVFRLLLQDPTVPAKDEILTGLAYWCQCYPLSPNDVQGDSVESRLNREIADGVREYIPWILSRSPEIRRAAALLLSVCLTHKNLAANAIINAIHVERIVSIKTEMLLRLGALARPADVSLFQSVAKSDAKGIVRLGALWGWLYSTDQTKKPSKQVFNAFREIRRPSWDAFFERFREHDIVYPTVARLAKFPGLLPVLLVAARNKMPEVRRWAAEWIAEQTSPEALNAMRQLMADPEPTVRQFAVFLVGQNGPEEAIEMLLERLRVSEEESEVATILRAINDQIVFAKSAIHDLCSLQETHSSEEIRNQASELRAAIEELHSSQDLEWLAKGMDDLRVISANRTGKRLTTFVIERITQIAKHKPDDFLNTAVKVLATATREDLQNWARLLRDLGPSRPGADIVLSSLRLHLQDKDLVNRILVGEAIRAIDPNGDDPQRVPSLKELRVKISGHLPQKAFRLLRVISDDTSPKQRNALWEMAQLKEVARPALPILVEALKKQRLHHEAAGAISWIDPDYVRPMVPCLLAGYSIMPWNPQALTDSGRFVGWVSPPLYPDVVAYLQTCLPKSKVKSTHPIITVVLNLQSFREPCAEVIAPFIKELLLRQWPLDHNGWGCPLNTVLKFLKSRGSAYSSLIPDVSKLLKQKHLADLAEETLGRLREAT